MWHHLIALIFPPRETQSILFPYAKLPTGVTTKEFLGKEITYLCSYTKPAISAAVVESKYFQNRKAHKLLSRALNEHLTELEPFDIIIPIPLSKERKKQRGHNQVESILKAGNIPFQSLLSRENAESQTTLNRQERIENVKGAFSLQNNDLSDKHILLVDDVVTTGATLTAAAKKLEEAKPASITLLALAH